MKYVRERKEKKIFKLSGTVSRRKMGGECKKII